jgi:hypothetical protein
MSSPRFELVMHHDYTSQTTADLSVYGNDGHRTPAANGGADLTVFDGNSTRVVALPSTTLDDLRGVNVQARVRVDRLDERRTLVEGYVSFALVVDADGSMSGSVYTGERWEDVRTPPDTVPVGQWIDVGFIYDGVDTGHLTLDGTHVAARYAPLGSVRGVAWPYGLNVGAWPDRDVRMLVGSISEVRVWRLAR